MTLPVPPPSVRFWFLAVGKRVPPEYRPWVAQQLNDPRYLRNRLGPSMVVPLVAVLLPQTLLALAAGSRLRLLVPVLVLVAIVVSAVVASGRTMSEANRRRLLAYHGVTAEGDLVQPVSLIGVSPLGKAGFVLLCAQLLVFSIGVVTVVDRIVTERACHVLPAADRAALDAVVGQPVPEAAAVFGAPAPIVAPGTPLVAAREVEGGFDDLRFVAAYVRDRSGRLVGPAVWRIIGRLSVLNPSRAAVVDAQDFLARQITPTTGYGGSSPVDAALTKARNCAKAARD